MLGQVLEPRSPTAQLPLHLRLPSVFTLKLDMPKESCPCCRGATLTRVAATTTRSSGFNAPDVFMGLSMLHTL